MYYNTHTHLLFPTNDQEFKIVNLPFDQWSLPEMFQDTHLFFSAGLHPWWINKITDFPTYFHLLEKQIAHPQIIAVGECGLDSTIEISIEEQKKIFYKHIMISETYKKPLIIHCVKRTNDLIRIHKECKPLQPWIVHGFRGKSEIARKLLEQGLHISIGNRFNTQLPDYIPVDRLLLETDDTNISIQETYQHVSLAWNIPLEVLVDKIKTNFLSHFPLNR